MLISMATHDPTHSPPLKSVPIKSIQPGGGLGPWLAGLWCSAFWRRNVYDPLTCSRMTIHFQPHPLRLARAGIIELFIFVLLLGGLAALWVWLALTVHSYYWLPAVVLLVLLLFVVSFFRDPERVIPSDPLALVSPADGTVTEV